jgi:hypothetical protein
MGCHHPAVIGRLIADLLSGAEGVGRGDANRLSSRRTARTALQAAARSVEQEALKVVWLLAFAPRPFGSISASFIRLLASFHPGDPIYGQPHLDCPKSLRVANIDPIITSVVVPGPVFRVSYAQGPGGDVILRA